MSVLKISEIQKALKSQNKTNITPCAMAFNNPNAPVEFNHCFEFRSNSSGDSAHVMLAIAVGAYTPVEINGETVNVFAINHYPVPVIYHTDSNSIEIDDSNISPRPANAITLFNHTVEDDLKAKFDLFTNHRGFVSADNQQVTIDSNPFSDKPVKFTTHPVTQSLSNEDLNQNISNAISLIEDQLIENLKRALDVVGKNRYFIFDQYKGSKDLNDFK